MIEQIYTGEIMMLKSLNIVIFGMSLRVLNDLKSVIIQIIPSHVQINWVNIASPQIDIILINETFFDVPSIQKIIHDSQIKVLQIATNNHHYLGEIENNRLNLPMNNNLMPLSLWLFDIVEAQEKNNYTSMINAVSETELSKKVSITPVNRDIQEIVREIQNPKNGKMQIFDTRGILAIVDPHHEWVWSKITDHALLRTDLSLNYTYSKLSDSDKYSADVVRTDMKNWLWNLIWQSPSLTLDVAHSAEYFIMDFWPHPLDTVDRRDVLRMSACFAHGATIKNVAQHLTLPEDRVRQFVTSSLAVNFARISNSSEAKFNTIVKASSGNQNFMKKLFGGLRKRLGL